jgi:AraC-like DNA-binding protein
MRIHFEPVRRYSMNGSPIIRFTTSSLAEKDRIPAWRDYWGQQVFGAELEPAAAGPFRADVSLRAFPGVNILSMRVSPIRLLRTSSLAGDGTDCVGLVTGTSAIKASRRGDELILSPGHATFVPTSDPSVLETRAAGQFRCMLFERAVLEDIVPDLDAAFLRPVAFGDPALQLLLSYSSIMLQEPPHGTAMQPELFAAHVRDLAALTLSREPDMQLFGKSARAAMLCRIKQCMKETCRNPDFGIGDVSRRLSISTRYIQRLFFDDGTTFSAHLLRLRLGRVYRLLTDVRFAGRNISEIVLSSGFNDISHFNRSFKKRYGHPPGELRRKPGDDTDPAIVEASPLP